VVLSRLGISGPSRLRRRASAKEMAAQAAGAIPK